MHGIVVSSMQLKNKENLKLTEIMGEGRGGKRKETERGREGERERERRRENGV